MSDVELALAIANGPAGAPAGGGSAQAAAEESLEYAVRTLASFERHHHRFSAEPVVYVAEVAERGRAPAELEAALRLRLPRLRPNVVTVGLPLLRGVAAASRAHLARGADLVAQWLVALAISRARRRWVVAVQPGVLFVEDDAVERLRARADRAGALVAGRLRAAAPGGAARLDPTVLLVDAERLRPRFPVDAWLDPAGSVEDRLRRVEPVEVAERARAARAVDLLAVLAAWLDREDAGPALLPLDAALEGFAAGDASAFASRAVVAGRYLDPGGAADLRRALERARLPRASARAVRDALEKELEA